MLYTNTDSGANIMKNKKMIIMVMGAAAVVLVLVLLLSLTMCGKPLPAAGSGEEDAVSEEISAEDNKTESFEQSAESGGQAAYAPAKDPVVGWYDTGLKCPVTTAKWENFKNANGFPMIKVGNNEYYAPEHYYYEDGSMFGANYNQAGEPDTNEIYTIKVYKNDVEVNPGEYLDESMVYRVFDGRDGSVTDHRVCLSMSLGGEGTNFSHEMWTAEREFTVTPDTGITAPNYFGHYEKFGFSVKILNGGKEVTGGIFKDGMIVRVSKKNGADFWDYKVVIDPNFITYAY